jgi:outer membrane protein OmpA-like peptidoglycan-associated protein
VLPCRFALLRSSDWPASTDHGEDRPVQASRTIPRVRSRVRPTARSRPRTTLPAFTTTVSGFTRYSNDARRLPASERATIESVARMIVASLARGGRKVHRVRLHGHADTDTPRRPSFEMRMSLERARRMRSVLSAAVDRIAASLPGPPALPPFSTRIDWRVSGAGATRLAVPGARTERDRARNRRVEILLYQRQVSAPSRPRSFALVGQAPTTSPVDRIIQEFLDAIGDAKIDRKNCFAAGTQVIQILQPGAPRGANCEIVSASSLVTAKSYQYPFSATVKCCDWNVDCDVSRFKTGCGKCSTAQGPFLILSYNATLLAQAVARTKCILDQGCVVRAGVLSGICDDKPDVGCARITKRAEVWRTCPEHWLVIIGYVGNAFVFWDSAGSSRIAKGGHEFGLLHYNPTENRLTTGIDMWYMDVKGDGTHTWNTHQKRYQVLRLQTGGRFKAATRSC